MHGGHDVQCPVDLTVPAAGESVAGVIPGGRVDRGGPGPGREVVVVAEAGDVTDLDEEPGRAGGPDPVQAGQGRARRGEQLSQLLVRGLLAGIDPLEVAHQLGRDPPTGLARHTAWAHDRKQLLGLRGGQVLLRPGRDQLQQKVMQLRDDPGVVLPQGPAPVDQHPQHGELLIVNDRAQPSHPGPTRAIECASVASVLRP